MKDDDRKRGTPLAISNPPAKQEEVYAKRRRAAELRRAGLKWYEIAVEVGYSDEASAYSAVKALLKEHQSLAYDEIALYRQENIDRLLDLLAKVWPIAMGVATKDKDMQLKAVMRAQTLISQIGDLTGEKMPVKVEIGESDVDRALRELSAELERRSAAAADQAAGVQAPASGADQPES